MEQKKFQTLLLETVICSIACDGDIDDREIAELHKMINQAQYFKGLDVNEFLDKMIISVRNDGRAFLGDYFRRLQDAELSPMQELLVLEVVLRIIQADERLDDNEIAFLHLVRSNLNVHNEIIHQRFGTVPYLPGGSGECYKLSKKQREDLVGRIANVLEIKDSLGGIPGKFMEKQITLDID
jgi:uncharacterized tellurite resistance protein B-like protein